MRCISSSVAEVPAVTVHYIYDAADRTLGSFPTIPVRIERRKQSADLRREGKRLDSFELSQAHIKNYLIFCYNLFAFSCI